MTYEEPTEHISKEHETRVLDSMWDRESITQKLMIKQKLKEIINPSSTSVGEPLIKETRKGRPSLQKSKTAKRRKVDTNTKRDLSGFEYAKFQSDDIGSSQQTVTKPKLNIRCSRQLHPRTAYDQYIGCIRENIRPFIQNIVDVEGDGNCGFHVCGLGLKMKDGNPWLKIRMDLIDELKKNMPFYVHLWGGDIVEAHIKRLDYHSKNAPPEHWIETPDHGQLLAKKYNTVVFSIGEKDCSTCIPFFTAAVEGFEENIFGMANIGNYHYVLVNFKSDAPLPPLTPEWNRWHSVLAESWRTKINERLLSWKEI